MSEPFWILWNEVHHTPPKVKFSAESMARAEAERMARAHPGARFHVMKHVDTCRKSDVTWDNLTEDDADIMF